MPRKRKRPLVPTEPQSLGELVAAAYPSREPADVAAIRALHVWAKAVPPRVLENARPVRVERGVLYLHASTSVWANELTLLMPELLARMRAIAPENGVKELRVRVGKLPDLARPRRADPPQPKPKPVAELPEELARALAAVADDGVRDAIAQAAASSLGREAQRRRRE